MTGRARAGWRLCLVAVSSALALPAGTAAADTPSPSSSGGPTPPGIVQFLVNQRQNGCVSPSGFTGQPSTWAQDFLRPDAVWPLTRGAGVKVAVVGSGVDGGSGVFGDRLEAGPREYDKTTAVDCPGHGTFIAGLIAAGQRQGVTFAGVAPEATVLSVAVTDDTGASIPDLLAKGIRAAADGGARVIDVVVPVPAGNDALESAVKYAVGKGALLIAPAAVDSGSQNGGVYPASYPDVLAVSDIARNGAPPQGQSKPGRIDLVAPGDFVTGIGPGGPGYFIGGGPSFATAFVAGTAALVLAYHPDLTGLQLLHRLEATANHPGTVMPDPKLGYGTVDTVAAVTAVLSDEQRGKGGPARAFDPISIPQG